MIHNLQLIEEMYERFLKDPRTCESTWRSFFEGMALGEKISAGLPSKEIRIYHLINAYRSFGHLIANINPIETKNPPFPHQLQLETLGFETKELKEPFPTLGLMEKKEALLQEIIATLQEIYGGTVGIEYMHTTSPEMQKWIQKEIEPKRFRPSFSLEKKRSILNWLSRSTLFETFMHTKYVGQKRFSLEGGETLIPILHELIEAASTGGAEEFVIGMAHRGRLNVLTNILGKSYSQVFSEFEDYYDPNLPMTSGDVKYHKGFSSNIKTVEGKQIHISLCANPSHLEAVCAIVQGKVVAKQVQREDVAKKRVIPIVIHGDASIAGQGVVYETMQMFNLPGYATGGTLHIVVNNQIGFTTLPKESRSTTYCTSLASAFSAPVFHVNAEDPEGCAYAASLALQIRQKFGTDVFIDMNCYRRHGHNEGDEPAFTQPLEYALIRKKKNIRELYLEKLVEEQVLENNESLILEENFKHQLHQQLDEIKNKKKHVPDEAFSGVWKKFRKAEKGELLKSVQTGVDGLLLEEIAGLFTKIPAGFDVHPKIVKLQEDRVHMVHEGTIDFGCAEHLAMASLLLQGIPVRLGGQDSRRGTFSQRHAVWIDQRTGSNYYPLKHLAIHQGRFDVFDSPLSEFSCLGFEFGYSLAYPASLVIWEAQYGDFANGGQIIIDQFISASEQKWSRFSGLVLLLPHGFEGQGPEHSSARLERFLQLAGDDNMQITYPTTPAQYFHLLRRQVLRPFRKPLIVMSPKGLLRHPRCKSTLQEFSGEFQDLIEDPLPKEKVTRLILTSGRIYYDLLEVREKKKREDIALVRLEQLYPLNKEKLQALILSYSAAKEVVWVQEEPENMGAWQALYPQLTELITGDKTLTHISRKQTAAVAVGSHKIHVKEQEEILNKAIP